MNTMKHRTVKIATGTLFILSLLVSSVSACSCPHHEDAAAPEATLRHLHSHSHEAESRHDSSKGSPRAISTVSPEDCCCMQLAPKAVTKPEVTKSEGKALNSSLLRLADPLFALVSVVGRIGFRASSFVAHSNHNLTPGRAPPRL